jgi:hypothetical protein
MNEYTPEFFDRLAQTAGAASTVILPLVFAAHPTYSVIDFGCGGGVWLAVCKSKGVSRVLGIDGPWVPRQRRVVGPSEFRELDMASVDTQTTLAFGQHPVFDLAICVEVAEHLPENRSEWLVRELCQVAPLVLFSAATPGQGGEGHINEQHHMYWERLFDERGMEHRRWIREAIAHRDDVPFWYRNNMSLYARRTA